MSTLPNKFRELDASFEQFLDGVLIEVEETELTPEKRQFRRSRADHSDLAFCRIYFPQIFSLPWNAMHRSIAKVKSGMWTFSGFRKCGKSAIAYVGKGIKTLCLNPGGIVSINCRTLDISDERTASLKRLMFRNPILIYDYDLKLEQDQKGHYIIGKTHLIAGSVNKGLRNLVDDDFKRIRVALNDDLYNKETVTSEYDNGRVVDFIDSEVHGQLEDGGLSITSGNMLSETCPIMQLRDKHRDRHFSLPALDEHGKSTWPEYKTEEAWEELTSGPEAIPWDIWMGEYMDQPSVKGEIFDPEHLRSINLNLVQIIASISACDPSFGKSPSACDKAIATVGATSKMEVIVQDLYLRKEDYSLLFDYVAALQSRIPAWKVLLFENDFNQWALAEKYYQDWMKLHKKSIPIVTHYASQLGTQHRGADKDSRILNLAHPLQTGMMLFAESILKTKDYERVKAQILAYGKSKGKLDGIDALATAYIMVFRYVKTGSFKSVKQRTFKTERTWLPRR